MNNIKIIYCGEDTVPHLNLSEVSLVAAYSSKNAKLCKDKNIPYINTYILHEPFYEYEERIQVTHAVRTLVAPIKTGTIVVHCQLGKSRSKDLAHALADHLNIDTVTRAFIYENKLKEYEEDTYVTGTFSKIIQEMLTKAA